MSRDKKTGFTTDPDAPPEPDQRVLQALLRKLDVRQNERIAREKAAVSSQAKVKTRPR